jgi:hypothetical protein
MSRSGAWRGWFPSVFVRGRATVVSSMPGAPPLRLTASQAAVAFSCRTTCSINSSCIPFCGESRVGWLLARPLPKACDGFSAWALVGRSGVATAVLTPRRFGRLCEVSLQVLIEFCSFVLRPFARNAFLFVRSSNATTASADCPRPLSRWLSPGQGLFCPFAPLGSTECRQ